jgi:tetratricopeptide (TPR) repeat protein
VRGVLRRAAIDQPGKLFVIIGGRTFSAAMNLALDLERWTTATFVGEPTGNATFFFGDHRQVVLPRSGITVNVSTLPWRPYDPRDRRAFLAPTVYAPMTSAAFAKGQDPAMGAILAFRAGPDLAAVMEAAITRGDSAAAEQAFERARREPANRFRRLELDVNRLGYSLLNAQRPAEALTVFRMNTRAYPRSANAWDSLGEALAISGMKDPAISAYRQALAVDPNFQPSRQALAKLGAARE